MPTRYKAKQTRSEGVVRELPPTKLSLRAGETRRLEPASYVQRARARSVKLSNRPTAPIWGSGTHVTDQLRVRRGRR